MRACVRARVSIQRYRRRRCRRRRRQVTFTFTLRRSPDPAETPVCRKEATFTFNRETDNRGWRECIPPTHGPGDRDARVYLTVEVRPRQCLPREM